MFQDYDLLNMIGEGSFGRVYKARRRYTGRLVAIKLINKLGQNSDDIITLRREIDLLSKVNHPNIMKMIDVFETDTSFCIVTELARGDLFQVIDDNQVLPESALRPIAAQLISAVLHLHTSHIIHRDLKPQNILVSSNGTIKVCDFGFARALSQTTLVLTSIKGTPLYMAPELVQEQPYNESIDIWSIGIILYELFHGSPPFYTESIYKLIQMIVNNPIRYPENMSPEFVSFLKMMLEKDPNQRATAKELLNHPFVQHIDLSLFEAHIYNFKSKQFENAIMESLGPNSTDKNFHPPKSKSPDFQMIFLSPSSFQPDEIKKALKFLKESNQAAESPLVASFAANMTNFLKCDPSVAVDVIAAATYVLQLDRERYTPQLLSIAEMLGQPNLPIEIIPFITELLVIPFASSKYSMYPYDSSFINLDEGKAMKLRDVLLSFIFTSDADVQMETFVFISYLLQISPIFFTTVCGDFIPQFAPLIVSALIRSESIVIKAATMSILTLLVESDPTAVFFIQPIDQFLETIDAFTTDDVESLEYFCCFSTILSFFNASFKEMKRIPKFKERFNNPENKEDLIQKIFCGKNNFSNRLGLLLMFGTQQPSTLAEYLSYVTILESPFKYIVVNEECLDTFSNYVSNLLQFHQPSLLTNILKIDQQLVISRISSLVSLFESQSATSIMSEYILNILTPELAEELLENDSLLSLSHVIAEMGPNVPVNTVLALAKIILSFTEGGSLLLEQSREVLTSIFSIDLAAESGLIIAAHFARISSAFIPSLSECGALNLAARALLADIPRIRGRALDFIGNFCKHTALPENFLDSITISVSNQLNSDDIDCLKMASFAISNILFHSPNVSDIVFDVVTLEKIEELLCCDDENLKLAENISAMCANMSRKSNQFVKSFIDSKILLSVLNVVIKGGNSSISSIKTTGAKTLLHLSVFFQYPEAIDYLRKNNAKQAIVMYSKSSNERIQRTAKKLLDVLN